MTAMATSYQSTIPGGVIVDLCDEGDPTGIKLLALEEATHLCRTLRRNIIAATLAIDPTSNVESHLDRMFA